MLVCLINSLCSPNLALSDFSKHWGRLGHTNILQVRQSLQRWNSRKSFQEKQHHGDGVVRKTAAIIYEAPTHRPGTGLSAFHATQLIQVSPMKHTLLIPLYTHRTCAKPQCWEKSRDLSPGLSESWLTSLFLFLVKCSIGCALDAKGSKQWGMRSPQHIYQHSPCPLMDKVRNTVAEKGMTLPLLQQGPKQETERCGRPASPWSALK